MSLFVEAIEKVPKQIPGRDAEKSDLIECATISDLILGKGQETPENIVLTRQKDFSYRLVRQRKNAMKAIKWLSIALGIFSLFAASASPDTIFAECICTCVNGVNQPLCTSSLDIPPICPSRICPIEPLSIEPIRPPRIPPIGTERCWMQQVLNPYTGRYEWGEICR